VSKKRVLDRRDQVDIVDLFDQRSLDDVIIDLQSMLHQYEEEIFTHDKEVKFETEYYGYDGGLEVYVRVDRWETDTEYHRRLAKETAAKEKARKAKETKKARAREVLYKKEADERAEYERLRAKFEVEQ
jgi:hypothetical protein